MKKKRFYNNKKRNQKWTEKEQGRKIEFSDKYVYGGSYSDKYDYLRPKEKSKKVEKHKFEKFLKNVLIVILCFLIVGVGYSFMDLIMEREDYVSSGTKSDKTTDTSSAISKAPMDLKCYYSDAVYFDNGKMLESVYNSAKNGSYNAVCVDIKRENGTISYKSSLESVDKYKAVSSPASDFKGSLDYLNSNKITVVARIFCYQDSIVPSANPESAILDDEGMPYIDSDGSTWLNPASKESYEYIEGIINEVHKMGINYFVLDGVDMPKELKSQYTSSFTTLTKRLYGDLGYQIKFINPIDQSIDSLSSEVFDTFDSSTGNKNAMYVIKTSEETQKVKEKLDSKKITNYILLQ